MSNTIRMGAEEASGHLKFTELFKASRSSPATTAKPSLTGELVLSKYWRRRCLRVFCEKDSGSFFEYVIPSLGSFSTDGDLEKK